MNFKIDELRRIVDNQGEIILQLLHDNEEYMLVEENLEARIRLLENENGFLEKENEQLRDSLEEMQNLEEAICILQEEIKDVSVSYLEEKQINEDLRSKILRLEQYIAFLEDID